jgi:hypothetical protein
LQPSNHSIRQDEDKDKTRQDKTRHDTARQGKARHGNTARQGKTRHDKTRQDKNETKDQEQDKTRKWSHSLLITYQRKKIFSRVE